MNKYENVTILLGDDNEQQDGNYTLYDLLKLLKEITPSAEMMTLENNEKVIVTDETISFQFLTHILIQFYEVKNTQRSIYFRKPEFVKATYQERGVAYHLFYKDGLGRFFIKTSINNMISLAVDKIRVINIFNGVVNFYVEGDPDLEVSDNDKILINGIVEALENAEKMAFYEKESFNEIIQEQAEKENSILIFQIIIVAIFILLPIILSLNN